MTFSNEIWASISDSAKDLIRKLMTVDLDKRICVEDALLHPWILNMNSIQESENTELDTQAMKQLKNFNIEM